LFIIDAESMVIFWPMLQFGCFSACASVACSISALAQVRNGPPDAVMMTRTSSSRLPEPRAADRGHDPIGRTGRRLDDRTLARPAFGAGAGQRVLQIAEQAWVGDGGKARVELLRKLRQIPDIAVGGQRLDPIAIGSGSQQIHRAVADRPGGSQDGHGPDGGCRGFVVTQGNGAHRLTKP
jgi:hypothetical protein